MRAGFALPVGNLGKLSKKLCSESICYICAIGPIGALSGGQQQRVFLARAIAQQADLLLLDEPLAAVDKKTEALIFTIYDELKAQGKTLLISCHEWGGILNHYDQLLLLNQRLVAYGAPKEVMTTANIEQAYGISSQPRHFHDALETQFFC